MIYQVGACLTCIPQWVANVALSIFNSDSSRLQAGVEKDFHEKQHYRKSSMTGRTAGKRNHIPT
jgi:hypothetical protein